MDVHDRTEVLELHLAKSSIAKDSGIVDGDIHAPPLGSNLGDHPFHLRKFRHVDLEAPRDTTVASNSLYSSFGVGSEIDDGNLCTARGESTRIAQAKTSGGPGHDSDAVLERYTHRLS